MKFRIYEMVLSLFFALGLVFSLGVDAQAHDYLKYKHSADIDVSAQDVGINSQEDMKKFISHLVKHSTLIEEDKTLSKAESIKDAVIIAQKYRKEEVFKDAADNVYVVGINSRGFIVNHALYPDLLGYRINYDAGPSEIAAALDKLEQSTTLGGPPQCEPYQHKGQDRVACAAEITSNATGVMMLIAGLHHEKDDASIVPPDCTGLSLATSAEDVYKDPTDGNLEAYVKSVIGAFQDHSKQSADGAIAEYVASGGDIGALLADPDGPEAKELEAKVLARFGEKIGCFGTGDFKHGNIYAFIMSATEDATVLLNGNNPDLSGLNLQLEDDQLPGDDKTIASLFRNALTGGSGEPKAGDSASNVKYRWANPETPEDRVENYLETNSVPGTSSKTSYIEVADLNAKIMPQTTERLYIFGSGFYPKDDAGNGSGSDGGCAVAGAGYTSKSALLSLLLTASVLVSAIFLRKRA